MLIAVMIQTIDKLNPSRFIASLSDSGSIIENSYLIQAMIPTIVVIEINKAQVPNSSGVYSLVSTGEASMVTIWAKVVPPTRVNTSDAKLVFFLTGEETLL